MNDHKINPDEAIDRVLTGLRKAEPLEGMQQRVLHAAKERASTHRGWTLKHPLVTTYSPAAAVATVAIIGLAASWTIARTHRIVQETAPAHLPSASAPVAELPLESIPTPVPEPPRQFSRAAAAEHVAHVEPLSDEEALAMSEMLAPSKPAPPLPLTHQERLLAEVIHRGAPEELASLRPDVRAREIEIAKAEFHDFFEPPSLNPPSVKANE